MRGRQSFLKEKVYEKVFVRLNNYQYMREM